MKKILISLTALALFACGEQSKTVTITGSVSLDNNAKEVVLVDRTSMNPIDTAAVEGGKFTFEVDATTPKVMGVTCGRMYTYVVTEPGTININLDQQSNAQGTPLTDALQAFLAKDMEIGGEFNKKQQELSQKYADDREKLNEELYKYYSDVYMPEKSKINEEVFSANKTNAIGAFLFLSTHQEVTVAQIDSFYTVNPVAIDYAQISDKRAALINKEKTAVGEMFVDFKARNIENTEDVNFSDIVGKGKYVLVDFWASWCGPCKAEMPNIKKVYDKYGKKNLVVLGVNVWDKHDAALKCMEEHKMVWSHIYASENNDATTLYGISGIPTLILFAPDGTILDRTFRGEEMVKKMDEYLKK